MNKHYKENHRIVKTTNDKVNLVAGMVMGFMIGLCFTLFIKLVLG